MRMKYVTAVLAAASLAAAPTIVAAQAQTAPAPKVQTVTGDSQLVGEGGFFLSWIPIALAVGAALTLAILLLDDDEDDDVPVSP